MSSFKQFSPYYCYVFHLRPNIPPPTPATLSLYFPLNGDTKFQTHKKSMDHPVGVGLRPLAAGILCSNSAVCIVVCRLGVLCVVEFCASGWSLMQRSPTEYVLCY